MAPGGFTLTVSATLKGNRTGVEPSENAGLSINVATYGAEERVP